MLISVIITTYNRAPILDECLEALEKQNFRKEDFEVIVVDDGSTDDTRKIVENYQNSFALKYCYQENQGQGMARNAALQHAVGEIIVFIQDDIIVTPDFLYEHLRIHRERQGENEAVLGQTEWHPEKPINDYMRWSTNSSNIAGRFGGHQFAYEKLKGKTEADYNFFYTSNLSLKKSVLLKHSFDPEFSGYGWEDIELGYRLYKYENLKLYYNPLALAYHDHYQEEASLGPRMRSIGKYAWIFHRKHPELKKVPSGFKYWILWTISRKLFIVLSKRYSQNIYYYLLSKKYFLEGVQAGRKEGIKL